MLTGRTLMQAASAVLLIALAFFASAQTAPDPVAPILAAANARLAAGEKEEFVEKWVQDQIRLLNGGQFQVQTAPPKWDVYAQAEFYRSERSAPAADDSRRANPKPSSVFVGTLPAAITNEGAAGHGEDQNKSLLPTGSDKGAGADGVRVRAGDDAQASRGTATAPSGHSEGVGSTRAAGLSESVSSTHHVEKGGPPVPERR